MTYGASKERDMVRSILPSSSRKSARDDKRAINKARRCAVRQALRDHRDALAHEGDTNVMRERNHAAYDGTYVEYDLCDYDWDYDAPYAKITNADGQYESQIKYAMWERRNADKVAPFQRWAAAQVGDIRMHDRLSWLQAKMPDTLAVRHAVSHVETMEEFDVYEEYSWRGRYRRSQEGREWARAAEYAQAVEDLYRVACGPIGRFNAFIPRTHTREIYPYIMTRKGWRVPRGWTLSKREATEWSRERFFLSCDLDKLMGVHDIEDFIQRVANLGLPRYDDLIKRALEHCFNNSADSYWNFSERSRFHAKN